MSSNTISPERYQTEKVDQSILGDAITLPFSGLVAKSRFLKSAMTERMSSWDQHKVENRGVPSERLVRLYEEWGKGGFGIILTGNTIVNPYDLEAPGNPIIHRSLETPERISAFRRQAEAAKKNGSLIFMQLSHAGRQVPAFIQPNPVSASDVQLPPRLGMTFAKPTALTREGIEDVIDEFAYAAEFAYKTGYNGVQLHAAHGYLLAQFLSQTTNKRTDEYGGSLENRARIIFRIVEEIRRRVPDKKFSLGIKINSAEFQEGGFQPDECREVCKRLEELGLDFVELSGGTYEALAFYHKRESTKKREAFFLEFADVIRPALSRTKVYVTGGFRTAAAMVQAIKNGSTDGIGLARPVCEEPDLPFLLSSGKVPSARKSLLDQNDFGLTNIVAGTQLTQIGSGRKPWDTTKEENVKRFMEELQKYQNRLQENMKKGVVEAGFPEIEFS